VLFDLDGTLLDTAPDMAQALNRLRLEENLPPLPFAVIRPMVSHGAAGLLKLSFGLSPEASAFHSLKQRFLELYAAGLATQTTLFPGMAEILIELEARHLPWGVVTNKPGWLTEPLLRKLRLWKRAACVVCGDTLSKRKPDPAPLLYASRLAGIAPEHCLYLGDAERDIEAGKRAGMLTLVACFGYLHDTESPEHWGADGLIQAPENLLGWLDSQPSLPSQKAVGKEPQN
jgi:phosphoglycolate phosphatase